MPTKRILYTLQEIKELIAKKEKVDVKCVCVYENHTLTYISHCGSPETVTEKHYMFQLDK